jgi:hypothetical protein
MTATTGVSPKPKQEAPGNYDTTDKVMAMALLMAGHRPIKIEQDRDSQLVYIFDGEEVADTVDSLRRGKGSEMMFSYAAYWSAEMTWQMNLRHTSRRRGK